MSLISSRLRDLIWAMKYEEQCLTKLSKTFSPWKLWKTQSFYRKQAEANKAFMDAVAERERLERLLEDAIDIKIREAIFADRRDKYI